MSANKQKTSASKRVINAFFYSIAGLKSCYQEEQAFRQELLLCLILSPVPFLISIRNSDRALMIFSLFLILIVELINTGIESVADRISTDHHELVKKAKDVGSAAVLLTIIATGIAWLLILI